MVTTELYNRFTKDKGEEIKRITKENHQFTKERNKRKRNELRNYKIDRKQNGTGKSLPSNYPKGKRICFYE